MLPLFFVSHKEHILQYVEKKRIQGGRMKRFLILFIILLTLNTMFAIPQNIAVARNAAENFISYKDQSFAISDSYTIANNRQNVVHVFNFHPDGFIAVSADNDVNPILAYSFTNRLNEEDGDENYLIKMMKDDVAKRMEYYKTDRNSASQNHRIWEQVLNGYFADRTFQQWPAAGSTPTDGWIETRWNQSGVYNQFCPLDDGGERSVVGCVATAMAMIIDFHETIGNVSFNDSDDYHSGDGGYIDNGHESRDYPTFPELNVMLDELAGHYENDISLTGQDKAALSFACGIAVEMYYSSDGSGSWTSMVPDALLDKFNFDSGHWIENNGGNFYTQLSNEMQNMRPVEISIYTSGWNNGHAIIVDGYNTDDYYHLNFGWGTSNSTCWYTLPYGMPNNYSIISGAAVNLEAGDVPVAISGNVNVNGANPVGAYITFEGDRFYEKYVETANGNFDMTGIMEGTYTATAILEDRTYYDSFEITISESSNFVQFNMGNFEAVTGTVNAPVSAEGCIVTILDGNEILHSGIADGSGNFSVPNVLPGDYTATASLNGNYFEQKEVTITLANQNIDFDLEAYEGNIAVSYAGPSTGVFSLVSNFTIGVSVLFTEDELNNSVGDVLSKIRFKSPINDTEGTIKLQVWEDDVLLSKKEITEFSIGEQIESELNNYIVIESGKDYYVGYEIFSESGDFAFHDDGPRQAGKGAFYKTTNWIELPPANFNYNFSIDAVIVSQEFASVSGNVALNGGDGNLEDVVVNSGNYRAHSDSNGDYELYLKAGNYDVTASLTEYTPGVISDIDVMIGDNLDEQNFSLVYGVSAGEESVNSVSALIGNYPNPFNPSTTISFTISNEHNERVQIDVFNVKGQKVKAFPINISTHSLINSITWNGTDQANNPVSSGLYFYKLTANGKTIDSKKMMLIK